MTKKIRSLEEIPQLSNEERLKLRRVANVFPVLVPKEYASLIDWRDPNDPIRRYVIPSEDELESKGKLDPSKEASNRITVDEREIFGFQHKYDSTALILASDACAGFCRPCFRKRFFLDGMEPEVIAREDIPLVVRYIAEHAEIEDVLITGGDSMFAPPEKLEAIISGLSKIERIKAIRMGTRVPVYEPQFVLNNNVLLGNLKRWANGKQLYIMTHYVHPREIRELSLRAIEKLKGVGAQVYSQTPMIAGVNDNAEVLHDLFMKLYANGITPHYIFVCRPTRGNAAYSVPIEDGYRIFEDAQDPTSGIGKHARYVMSHSTGKIQVTALDEKAGLIFMKYHRAKDAANYGKVMVFARKPDARWFDEYKGREIDLSKVRREQLRPSIRVAM